MKTLSLLLIPWLIVLTGCSTVANRSSLTPSPSETELVRKPLEGSLFPSDQAILSDEAINRILGNKLELPAKAKVAVLRFPSEGYGHYYLYNNEDQFRKQQDMIEVILQGLRTCPRISEAVLLPSLLTPKTPSIPFLREAAVRLQSDLLVIFRIKSNVFYKSSAFSKDRVKVHTACEMVLLDVRTGVVPFSKSTATERVETRDPKDFDSAELVNRVEKETGQEALRQAVSELSAFLK